MLDRLSPPASGLPLPDTMPDAYALARRHSVRVKRLKVVLPIAALLVSLTFIGVSLVRTWVPDEVSLESATIEDGKIVMQRPALAGRNNKGFDYSMNAERALQDVNSPNLMMLEKVLAAVPMNDVVAQVVANEGLFDRASNKLKMTAPFDINLSNGLKAKFKSADVDLKAGTMGSDEEVAVNTDQGSIVAQSLRIADNGKTITFSGQVRARIAASTIQNAGK